MSTVTIPVELLTTLLNAAIEHGDALDERIGEMEPDTREWIQAMGERADLGDATQEAASLLRAPQTTAGGVK